MTGRRERKQLVPRHSSFSQQDIKIQLMHSVTGDISYRVLDLLNEATSFPVTDYNPDPV